MQEIDSSGDNPTDLAAWNGKPFLEKVTNIAPSVIYVFNQETQANEYSNRSIASSLGYSSEEIREMGAELMPRLLHPEDMDRVFHHFGKLQGMKDGEISEVEYRMKNRAGGWTWFLSYDTIFDRTENGQVLRHLGVANDITAQKEAELHALEQEAAAKAANKELTTFAYSVSHDLKSPSNTLKMLLSEVQDSHTGAMDATGEKLIADSLATVDRMQALITDVLAYTRIVGQEIEQGIISLETLMATVCQDLQAEIDAKDAQISIEPLPVVIGNEQQLRVLFQNLISNAIKFSQPDKTPELTIKEVYTKGTDTCCITVQDNGIGIAKSDQEQIFDLFHQLHPHHMYEGTGLGLAICRRIANKLGGSLELASELGKGSVFSLHLLRA